MALPMPGSMPVKPLQHDAVPYRLETVEAIRAQPDERTLALVRYGRDLPVTDDPRVIDIGLDLLGGVSLAQHWRSPTPVRIGQDEGLRYACNGEVLIGSLRLEERELGDMAEAAFQAYLRMDRLLQAQGYPGCLRVWIYMGGITRGEGDDERYRQFTLGRHRALSLKPDFERNLPAATAIGTHGEGLTIYFLAAPTAGIQIENPRQVSAFHYPRAYGPRSPSFSRATLKRWAEGAHLYVSGTASIVGHESRHPGDPALQLEEIAHNLRELVQGALDRHPTARSFNECRALGLKLYLRQRHLLAGLRQQLPRLFGADTPILCLEGDICRDELLVEVEGIYTLVPRETDAAPRLVE